MNREALEPIDGDGLFLDRSEAESGTEGPFFVVYLDADAAERWGFYCGHCDSTDTAMDTMGRIACNDCGNMKKPDEWDSAHE